MSLNQVANAVGEQLQQYTENVTTCLEELSEEQVWLPGPDQSNPIGTLAHHLSGNLRHFFGAGLSKDGYVRDRLAEFSDRQLSSKELSENLKEALRVAKEALKTMGTPQVETPHESVDGREFYSLAHMLLQMTAHFAYHAGQVNYATRMLRA